MILKFHYRQRDIYVKNVIKKQFLDIVIQITYVTRSDIYI